MISTGALSLITGSCQHLSTNNGEMTNNRGTAYVSWVANGQCDVLKMRALSTRRCVFQPWGDSLLAVWPWDAA